MQHGKTSTEDRFCLRAYFGVQSAGQKLLRGCIAKYVGEQLVAMSRLQLRLSLVMSICGQSVSQFTRERHVDVQTYVQTFVQWIVVGT